MGHDEAEPQGSLHRPNQDWYCTDDGEEWPCPIHKRRMWTYYQDDHLRLEGIMNRFRDRAMVSGMSHEIATARFVGWVRNPPVRQVKRSI
ncbi:hypothetical protein OG792_24095 [Micromonospora sp. NBC_01699]|uniref:hypothetical protein n=1 Tax=Micromonospora sp. NBC_01699 TaxID=2975984 RepID=UPI002E2C0129|nr:hypothetical protein [Micromonospora sp. NBC_01699]